MLAVPRVRVRSADSRRREELLELAVLNERLAGANPVEVRKRLEHLRRKTRNWEFIYNYITKEEATATLAAIEAANLKAEEVLSEEYGEQRSVVDLREELVRLQTQVDEAREKLEQTQQRVDSNLQRVNQLKAEAAALESAGLVTVAAASHSTSTGASTGLAVASRGSSPPSTPLVGAAASTAVRQRSEDVVPPVVRRKDRGLKSSLEMEEPLKNFWYPAYFASKLDGKTMVPFDLFNEPWVLFRDELGRPACIKDQCAHRACPLSLGSVNNGHVVCPYHGWEYNAEGSCTKMPSTRHCKNIAVAALPCIEKNGFIWVWPGEGTPTEVPDFTQIPDGYTVHAEIMVDVPVEHGLLVENLLDLAHAPFTHTSTFARGWPIPDAVKFHANKLLSGYWDPYPIEMSFLPPCVTESFIGIAQVGKVERGLKFQDCEKHLYQMHVCLPSKPGHTRLLYRMAMDFMPWIRNIPYIDMAWKKIAAQVLGEDLVLVTGQQERMLQGGDIWANPVSYDKIGVRYRRWRNAVADNEIGSETTQLIRMDAGEMFALDDGFADDRPQGA